MKTTERQVRANAARLESRAEAIAVRLLVARARALRSFDERQDVPIGSLPDHPPLPTRGGAAAHRRRH